MVNDNTLSLLSLIIYHALMVTLLQSRSTGHAFTVTLSWMIYINDVINDKRYMINDLTFIIYQLHLNDE